MPTHQIELSHEDIQTVMSNIEIPSCPKIVTDTMKEAQKDEPDMIYLASLITSDAGMSAAAIKLANSTAFGGGGKAVSSVKKAIERLGIKNLVCVVIATALRDAFVGVQDANWLDAFWKDALLKATATHAIARKLYGISPDAAFTYALFHNAAIPLMVKRFPNYLGMLAECKQNSQLLILSEANLYPCTHPVVGSLLINRWGLPPILGHAIRFHHEADAYELSDRTLPGGALSFIATTQIAEKICAELQGEPDLEVGDQLFEKACAYLGLGTEDIDQFHHILGEMV